MIIKFIKSSADAQDHVTCHTYKISHLKRLAIGEGLSTTLKVITIADIRYAVYKHHFLLVTCCYNISIEHHFQYIITFAVYMTACDLETSFTFDNSLNHKPPALSNSCVNIL